ncbi:MAG: prepilin-type N-terminal cleavage/methylation domain-containing protein [Planctomycetota bacterium]
MAGRKTANRTGLTLIELMAALLLSAMLLAAITGLCGRLAEVNRQMLNAPASPPWHYQLENHLQKDFQNCRSVQLTPNRLLLAGYFTPDVSRGGLTPVAHAPMQIAYEVTSSDGRAMLLRRETRLDRTTGDGINASLVALDVASIRSPQRLDSDVAPGQLTVGFHGTDGEPLLVVHLTRHGEGTAGSSIQWREQP